MLVGSSAPIRTMLSSDVLPAPSANSSCPDESRTRTVPVGVTAKRESGQLVVVYAVEDLDEATRIATREMVDFLVSEKHLSRDDAHMLCALSADHGPGGTARRRSRRAD